MKNFPLHHWLLASRKQLLLHTSPVRVLGIDLGTTTSVVAEMTWHPGQTEPAVPRCIKVEQPTTEGPYIHALVPSVVALLEETDWIGEGARRLRAKGYLRRNRDIFYECKNDMGLRRTYHLAPEGYRSAAEIAGRILAFLRSAAGKEEPVQRTVITVPASFQVAQRQDTLKAAELAGIELQPGDLLDEPVAAFLDYLMTHGEQLRGMLEEPRNLLIFDFGGGTCDVGIFRVSRQQEGAPGIAIAPRAVSRYYRVGGGDIDAAIVHQVLIPQLIAQEGMHAHDLDYDIRKRKLEPALLNVAERLKIGLSDRIRQLKAFGKYEKQQASEVYTLPGAWPCPISEDEERMLYNPQLTATEFERVLGPYVDADHLYTRETEYYLTCSVLASVQDALDRAGLSREAVDLCLLVGGSSLIPQVEEAVETFLPSATLLTYSNYEETRLTVARGAAYHALSREMLGASLIQPIVYDVLALKTQSGLFTLIPGGMRLPFPAEAPFAEIRGLAVPESRIMGTLPLQVTLVAGSEGRAVFNATWQIPGPVNRGDRLIVRVHMDENQHLKLELVLADRPDDPFTCTVENPLTHVVRPERVFEAIYETEEKLRTGQISGEQVPDALVELARKYHEVAQIDRSIDYLNKALRIRGGPDSNTLNLLGIYYGEKGDYQRQEKAYLEAYRTIPQNTAPLFNLALSLYNQGRYAQAQQRIEQALEIRRSAPHLILYATILAQGGHTTDARIRELMEEALTLAGPVHGCSEWELGWLQKAARYLDRVDLQEELRQEIQRRAQQVSDEGHGILPEIEPGLQRV